MKPPLELMVEWDDRWREEYDTLDWAAFDKVLFRHKGETSGPIYLGVRNYTSPFTGKGQIFGVALYTEDDGHCGWWTKAYAEKLAAAMSIPLEIC